MTARFQATALLKLLFGITMTLLATHLLLQYLNWEVFYQQNGLMYELANRFDLDDESSVATWYSQILLLLIGIGGLLAAYLETKNAARKHLWRVIGVIGLVLSIDESAGLHEFVLQSLHNIFFRDQAPTGSNNAWGLVAPFLLVGLMWLGWKVVRLLPRRTTLLFVLATSIYLGGAIGVDLITSLVERESFLHQGVLVAIEETLELLGTVIVVYAVADYLQTHHRAVLQKSARQLRLKTK